MKTLLISTTVAMTAFAGAVAAETTPKAAPIDEGYLTTTSVERLLEFDPEANIDNIDAAEMAQIDSALKSMGNDNDVEVQALINAATAEGPGDPVRTNTELSAVDMQAADSTTELSKADVALIREYDKDADVSQIDAAEMAQIRSSATAGNDNEVEVQSLINAAVKS